MRRDSESAGESKVFQRLGELISDSPAAMQSWSYDSVSAARAGIADYFDWYNTHRPHSKLEWLTPQEKYVATLPKLRLTA